MTIDPMASDPSVLPSSKFLRPSHRTIPEQLVGLSIFLSVSILFEILVGYLATKQVDFLWFRSLAIPSFAIRGWLEGPLWTIYHLTLPLSVWTIWRRNSLKTIKLECSIFSTMLLLQFLWGLSFFIFQQPLLALVALLLLFCSLMVSMLLFWKKELLSGIFLLVSFLWIFYVMAIKMAICILNP